MPNYPETVIVKGVSLSNFVVMPSKFNGICTMTGKKFSAGEVIIYKNKAHLSQEEVKLFRGRGIYNVTIPWSAVENNEDQYLTKSKNPVKTKTDFTPSEYQKQIDKILRSEKCNILISALAGCGKTTTLLKLIAGLQNDNLLVGRSVYFLAFNANLRDEVTPELSGSGVIALTTHQFCLRKILKYKISLMEKNKGERNRRVFLEVVKNLLGATTDAEAKSSIYWEYRSVVLKLVPLVKNWAICPDFYDQKWVFSEEKRSQIISLISQYKINVNEDLEVCKIVDLACGVISSSLCAPGTTPSEYDFDDMLYHVLVFNYPIPKVDLVFVDEVQDWNSAQLRILGRMENAGCRVVAVGDNNQAIYMFRGADSRAWQRLILMLEKSNRGMKQCELPINYRSEPEVLDYAKEIVPGLIPFKERQGKGKVCFDTTFSDMCSNVIDGSQHTMAVLCRNRAPLVQTGYHMIVKGVKVCFLGKGDFAFPLKTLIDKVSGFTHEKSRSNCIYDVRDRYGLVIEEGLLTRVQNYFSQEKTRYQHDESRVEYLEELSDICECVILIASNCKGNTVDDVKADIDNCFVDKPEPGALIFTTVHSAKGLQWEIVYIIRKDLLPSPRVQTHDRDGNITDEFQQEINLDYIARSRAERETHVVCDWPFESKMGEEYRYDKEDSQEVQDFWATPSGQVRDFDENLFDPSVSFSPTVPLPNKHGKIVNHKVSTKKLFVDDGMPF